MRLRSGQATPRRLRATVTETTLSEHLAVHPEVVTQLSMYSDDKRTTGGRHFVDDDYTRTIGRLGPSGARGDERTYNAAYVSAIRAFSSLRTRDVGRPASGSK